MNVYFEEHNYQLKGTVKPFCYEVSYVQLIVVILLYRQKKLFNMKIGYLHAFNLQKNCPLKSCFVHKKLCSVVGVNSVNFNVSMP